LVSSASWLSEAASAPVEEHLLVCEECRARLAEWNG
jgi:anti-sigma factor RsiW